MQFSVASEPFARSALIELPMNHNVKMMIAVSQCSAIDNQLSPLFGSRKRMGQR